MIRITSPVEPGASVDAGGCMLTRLPEHPDQRGVLSVAELGLGLPFEAVRLYTISNVPQGARRGGHAHRRSHELLCAVGGSVTVEIARGGQRWQVVLDSPSLVLHVPPLVWTEEHSFGPGTTLVALSSGPFDPSEYVYGEVTS